MMHNITHQTKLMKHKLITALSAHMNFYTVGSNISKTHIYYSKDIETFKNYELNQP